VSRRSCRAGALLSRVWRHHEEHGDELVALVKDPNRVRRFLGHLGLPVEPPPHGPARGLPFARGPERRLRPSAQAEMFHEG